MVVAIGLALSCANVNCKSTAKPGPRRTTQESLEAVGREVGFSFPATAKLIGVHRERGADDLIAVKVELPATEWQGFLSHVPVDASLFRAGERGLLGPDQGFWDPHKAQNLRTVETALPNGRVLNLGYDDGRASVVAVYVVNHGI
jgi:hypothetical protein